MSPRVSLAMCFHERCKLFPYYQINFFNFRIIPGSAQVLLLAVPSEIIPGSLGGTMWMGCCGTCVGACQANALLAVLSFSLHFIILSAPRSLLMIGLECFIGTSHFSFSELVTYVSCLYIPRMSSSQGAETGHVSTQIRQEKTPRTVPSGLLSLFLSLSQCSHCISLTSVLSKTLLSSHLNLLAFLVNSLFVDGWDNTQQ